MFVAPSPKVATVTRLLPLSCEPHRPAVCSCRRVVEAHVFLNQSSHLAAKSRALFRERHGLNRKSLHDEFCLLFVASVA